MNIKDILRYIAFATYCLLFLTLLFAGSLSMYELHNECVSIGYDSYTDHTKDTIICAKHNGTEINERGHIVDTYTYREVRRE